MVKLFIDTPKASFCAKVASLNSMSLLLWKMTKKYAVKASLTRSKAKEYYQTGHCYHRREI